MPHLKTIDKTANHFCSGWQRDVTFLRGTPIYYSLFFMVYHLTPQDSVIVVPQTLLVTITRLSVQHTAENNC
jgi:hypothetical protein